MTELDAWGPLAPLIGEWEGDEGLDVSFDNDEGRIVQTPYRERTTMKPFGPVDNGSQRLYGLDYRTAAWQAGQDDPFHTEVGYWLWDQAAGTVMRCFVIPRGSTVLAGGQAGPADRRFTMSADCGSEVFGVLSNPYLAKGAKTTTYTVDITVHDDGSWSYDETSSVEHARTAGVVAHTDRNRMRRAAEPS